MTTHTTFARRAGVIIGAAAVTITLVTPSARAGEPADPHACQAGTANAQRCRLNNGELVWEGAKLNWAGGQFVFARDSHGNLTYKEQPSFETSPGTKTSTK